MPLPKAMGRDCETSTTGVLPSGEAMSSWEVTRRVLERIGAIFEPLGTSPWTRDRRRAAGDGGWSSWSGNWASAESSDCLRWWTPNGQCFYSDMSHVEVCTAETRSPRAYAAQCLSALRVVEAARAAAQAAAEPGTRLELSASNVDALDPAISWGTHVNVEVARELWEDLFLHERHPAVLGYVASALAAAVPFFGCGYLLPLSDGSCLYSLSARAHHLACLKSATTTEAFARGILNARREPHAKEAERLHLIGFDFALASAALQSSFVQCALAAAEEGFCGLNLYDPVRALRSWSYGLDLRTGRHVSTAQLVDGRRLTLPEYMGELASTLLRMRRARLIDEAAGPQAEDLLPRVVALAVAAGHGQVGRSAVHLDWAAKVLFLLDRFGLDRLQAGDPDARLADHDFASSDPERGAFWRLWRAGRIDPLVTESDVEACLRDGPEDCRGFGRGRLIRRFGEEITAIDWGHVELRLSPERWHSRLRVEMPRLDSLNRAEIEPILDRARDVSELGRLLQRGRSSDADPLDDVTAEIELEPGLAQPRPYTPEP